VTDGPSGATLPTVRVLPDAGTLAGAAAAEIVRSLTAAVIERGVAHWCTTGGSTAPGIYRALREPPLRDAVDWSRVHTWWGDDRFVLPDDPLSNVLPFNELLLGDAAGLDPLPIPPANVHPIPIAEARARSEGPGWAAARYEEEIRSLVPAGADGLPVFDVILLGVGPDGHILSIFPRSAAWDEDGLCVGVAAPTHVMPRVERVTMHPRLLAAARSVLLVTAGASKAALLGDCWTGDDVRGLPVRATRLPHATWLLDEAAASALPRL
jgi:6-phosphogluconolactonase